MDGGKTMSGGRRRAWEIPDAVAWSEDMRTSPQSLRYFERRIEGHLAFFGSAVLPYRWGVIDYSCSAEDLARDCVLVERLEAVMPDGLVVWHRAPETPPLTIDLGRHRAQLEKGTCTIHLAVAAAQGWRASESESAATRYAPVTRQVMQDNRLIDLPCLRPVLTLILTEDGKEPPPHFTSLPLQKIGLREGRVCALPYDPPHVTVRRGFESYKAVGRTVAQLRKAATEILADERAKTLSVPEEMRLRALASPLLKLEAMLAQEASHPFEIYLALAETLGALSIQVDALLPAALAPYVHADALGSLKRVTDDLDARMERLESRFEVIPFVVAPGGTFSLALDPGYLQDNLLVQLFAAPHQPLWQVEQWARHALIGDRDRMAQIREARALGASRMVTEADGKTGLTRAPGAVLVRIPLRTPAHPSGLQLGVGRTIVIESENPNDQTGQPEKAVLYAPKASRAPKK